LVENKEEKLPRKLSINVDPAVTAEGNKTLTPISTNNTPESVNKAGKASHAKLKQ